ncbi:MAG: hypothetical protein FJ276_17875 [Planctomycetes bacterium]|nr:hypothetical protein [Planctomycetota bacterium]
MTSVREDSNAANVILVYRHGIREPTSPALFLGQRVHQGLEVWNRHRQLGAPIDTRAMADQMLSTWDQAVAEAGITFADPAEEESLRRQAVDLVAAYLAAIDCNEPRPLAVETCRESPLVDPATGEDLGTKLLGVIPRIPAGQANEKPAAKCSPRRPRANQHHTTRFDQPLGLTQRNTRLGHRCPSDGSQPQFGHVSLATSVWPRQFGHVSLATHCFM